MSFSFLWCRATLKLHTDENECSILHHVWLQTIDVVLTLNLLRCLETQCSSTHGGIRLPKKKPILCRMRRVYLNLSCFNLLWRLRKLMLGRFFVCTELCFPLLSNENYLLLYASLPKFEGAELSQKKSKWGWFVVPCTLRTKKA